MYFDESFWFLGSNRKKVHWVSSCGRFLATKEFRSQCCILLVNTKLQIQAFFGKSLQKALNVVLICSGEWARRELLIPWVKSKKGPLGVELWSFYCSKRISVPMSYITFLYRCVVIIGFQKKQKKQKEQRKYPQILNSLFFGWIFFVLLGIQQRGFSLCRGPTIIIIIMAISPGGGWKREIQQGRRSAHARELRRPTT